MSLQIFYMLYIAYVIQVYYNGLSPSKLNQLFKIQPPATPTLAPNQQIIIDGTRRISMIPETSRNQYVVRTPIQLLLQNDLAPVVHKL